MSSFDKLKRERRIIDLCENVGVPEMAGRLTNANVTVEEAQSIIEGIFDVEYERDRDQLELLGVSQESYLESRKVDLRARDLWPWEQPAAA